MKLNEDSTNLITDGEVGQDRYNIMYKCSKIILVLVVVSDTYWSKCKLCNCGLEINLRCQVVDV